MEKKKLVFIRSERREHDSGSSMYNIFTTEDGKQLAVKQNNISSYMGALKEGETYVFFLSLGTCFGLQYKETLIFNWAGRVIMKKEGSYFEMNPTRRKKPLTEEQLVTYTIRFFGANAVVI